MTNADIASNPQMPRFPVWLRAPSRAVSAHQSYWPSVGKDSGQLVTRLRRRDGRADRRRAVLPTSLETSGDAAGESRLSSTTLHRSASAPRLGCRPNGESRHRSDTGQGVETMCICACRGRMGSDRSSRIRRDQRLRTLPSPRRRVGRAEPDGFRGGWAGAAAHRASTRSSIESDQWWTPSSFAANSGFT